MSDKYESKYDRTKRIVLENLPTIPDVITREWLEESLKNEYYYIWGFTFSDLSKKSFTQDIPYNLLRTVSFSSKTIFPNNSPISFDWGMLGDCDDGITVINPVGIIEKVREKKNAIKI